MKKFHEAGARLIIWTVRGNIPLIKKWFKDNDIPYDYINENPDQPPDSSCKVYADAYWDDRAYNAEDLDKYGPKLLDRVKEHDKAATDAAFMVTPEQLLEALLCLNIK
jgi:hypothetical protein